MSNLKIFGKKMSCLMGVLLFCSSLALAQAVTPSPIDQGSAGVVKDGKYMTFYSAGLYVEPIDDSQVPLLLPAVGALFQFISSRPYLDLDSQNRLLEMILPTTKRQYKIATPDLLTPEVKQKLLAEYQRVTGVDPAHLSIFALTDTQQRITYILPGFEKLSMNDQMAILFHEAYWLYKKSEYGLSTDFDDAVKAEMAFQAALTHPDNAAFIYDFVNHFADYDVTRKAQLNWALADGQLNGFLNSNNQFSLSQLLGDDYLKCWKKDPSRFPLQKSRDSCFLFFRNHLNDLLVQYPKSIILREVAHEVDLDDSGDIISSNFSSEYKIGNELLCDASLSDYVVNFSFNDLKWEGRISLQLYNFANKADNSLTLTWDLGADASGCWVSVTEPEHIYTANTTCAAVHLKSSNDVYHCTLRDPKVHVYF